MIGIGDVVEEVRDGYVTTSSLIRQIRDLLLVHVELQVANDDERAQAVQRARGVVADVRRLASAPADEQVGDAARRDGKLVA